MEGLQTGLSWIDVLIGSGAAMLLCAKMYVDCSLLRREKRREQAVGELEKDLDGGDFTPQETIFGKLVLSEVYRFQHLPESPENIGTGMGLTKERMGEIREYVTTYVP